MRGPIEAALEQRLLGDDFIPIGAAWYADGDAGAFDPNLPQLREPIEVLAARLHRRLATGVSATDDEPAAYRDLVLYLLGLRFEDRWLEPDLVGHPHDLAGHPQLISPTLPDEPRNRGREDVGAGALEA